ncbi:hypothetical protein ACCS86_37520, partial [Rhizobium ruizarguesonis]
QRMGAGGIKRPIYVLAVDIVLAGQTVPHQITVKPTLLTQESLRAAGVKTIEELAEKIQAFSTSDAATARWIPDKLF